MPILVYYSKKSNYSAYQNQSFDTDLSETEKSYYYIVKKKKTKSTASN